MLNRNIYLLVSKSLYGQAPKAEDYKIIVGDSNLTPYADGTWIIERVDRTSTITPRLTLKKERSSLKFRK